MLRGSSLVSFSSLTRTVLSAPTNLLIIYLQSSSVFKERKKEKERETERERERERERGRGEAVKHQHNDDM